MNSSAVRDAFTRAVGVLVDEKGAVKDRLLTAYASQLSSIDPKRDLPSELSDQYMSIRYALSDEGMPYGYGEHATKKLEHMSDDEASDLARQIFSIFLKLADLPQHAGN